MTTQAQPLPLDYAPTPPVQQSLFPILAIVSFCHLLNDMVQSLLPAMYPILQTSFKLSFTQLGILTLTTQIVASLLQPVIGRYTDARPMPFSLAIGMTATLLGILILAIAPSFPILILSSAVIGFGSAVFHPEAARVARLTSGGRHGFAQSFFQVGGNTGSAIGPLLAAAVVLPLGQIGTLWFTLAALLGIFLLLKVGRWYKAHQAEQKTRPNTAATEHQRLPNKTIFAALAVLLALIFSKYFYLAGMTSFYTFYLIEKFHVSVAESQIRLFVFLGAVAAGTFFGGPIGDRFGRKKVIWVSILGALPFTLALPHANLFWTGPLSIAIGFIIASAFSAILVYGQELIPGRVGTISGLFFGFAFGMGGIGAATLGKLADVTSVNTVFLACALLPALGILTAFLPNLDPKRP